MESLHDAQETIDGTYGQETHGWIYNGHVKQEENITDLAIFRVVSR